MHLHYYLRAIISVFALGLCIDLQAQVSIKNSADETTAIFLDNGNVGIGTINPSQKLEVIGTIKATAFTGNGSGLTGTGDNLGNHIMLQNLRLNNFWLSGDGGAEGIFINADGKIGLGTNDPDTTVEVHKVLYLGGDGNVETGETVGVLGWFNNDANSLNQVIGEIRMFNRNNWWDGDVNKLDAAMTFSTMENGVVSEALRIDYNGRVGIGVTVPGYKLEVNGTFQADNVRSGTLDLPVSAGLAGQFLSYNGTWATPAAGSYTAGDDLDLTGTEFSLENDITIGDLRAVNAAGLKLYDDGGNMGFYMADGGYIGIGQTTLTGTARVEIANMTSGVSGLKIFTPGQSGVVVQTPAVNGIYVTSPGYYGFAVEAPTLGGYYVNNSASHGIYVSNSADHGIYINNSTEYGMYVRNSSKHGIRVTESDWWGIVVDTAGWAGLCVKNAGTHGIDIYNTGQSGVQITNAAEYGVYVASATLDGLHVASAQSDGVEAYTDHSYGEWGVYTDDKIHGSNVTMGALSMYGYNDGPTPLEPGDVVAVSGDFQAFLEGPGGSTVLRVRKAGPDNTEAVVGVVEYKVILEPQKATSPEGKIITRERFVFDGESVGQGDYLSIVVFGVTDVKVSGREPIKAGQKLTAAEHAGAARAITPNDAWSSGILGKALESSNGNGTIKALVNCR